MVIKILYENKHVFEEHLIDTSKHPENLEQAIFFQAECCFACWSHLRNVQDNVKSSKIVKHDRHKNSKM